MATRRSSLAKGRDNKLKEAVTLLDALGFRGKQRNEIAAYSLLALLDLKPAQRWEDAMNPLRGITPIIAFIREAYGVHYAPNTRETIRDEAVKYFVEAGLLVRNPDAPDRPTNSGKTVYQVETQALDVIRSFGTIEWTSKRNLYLGGRERIRHELERERKLPRVPVTLPSGVTVTLSPGGQNPLIKIVVEEFCSRFAPGAKILYLGDAEDKFLHLDAPSLEALGVTVPAPAKMPDVVAYAATRNWLLLIEAVASAGPVDGKRRKELKDLFAGARAGLVFVTAFPSREVMRSFLTQISWETEVWVADHPDHIIHFDGERFLGPYPDVLPESVRA